MHTLTYTHEHYTHTHTHAHTHTCTHTHTHTHNSWHQRVECAATFGNLSFGNSFLKYRWVLLEIDILGKILSNKPNFEPFSIAEIEVSFLYDLELSGN